jgi:hypothetical protein
MAPPRTQTIFEKAESIVNGPRQESYGPPWKSLERIAAMWSVVLHHKVSPVQVSLMMVGLKLVRETKDPDMETGQEEDNYIDMAGYLRLAEMCGFMPPEKSTGESE